MSLNTLIDRELVTCSPEMSVKQAADLMEMHDIGACLVVKNDKPLGILTDRDIVLRCVCQKRDPEQCRVEDAMTTPIQSVSLHDGIFDVIQMMQKNEIRRVPVVDEKGNAVGLVSFGDIFQLLSQELFDLARSTTPKNPKLIQKAA